MKMAKAAGVMKGRHGKQATNNLGSLIFILKVKAARLINNFCSNVNYKTIVRQSIYCLMA